MDLHTQVHVLRDQIIEMQRTMTAITTLLALSLPTHTTRNISTTQDIPSHEDVYVLLEFDDSGPINPIVPRGRVPSNVHDNDRPDIPNQYLVSRDIEVECEYSKKNKWGYCEYIAHAKVMTCLGNLPPRELSLCKHCFWREVQGKNPRSHVHFQPEWDATSSMKVDISV